ncbi:hypothetical protein B0H11DRAFT_1940772 [Mycena galericulata]|nr:hypothetical protein B0H11DRAFT_1940772 [Mycena galericulata]
MSGGKCKREVEQGLVLPSSAVGNKEKNHTHVDVHGEKLQLLRGVGKRLLLVWNKAGAILQLDRKEPIIPDERRDGISRWACIRKAVRGNREAHCCDSRFVLVWSGEERTLLRPGGVYNHGGKGVRGSIRTEAARLEEEPAGEQVERSKGAKEGADGPRSRHWSNLTSHWAGAANTMVAEKKDAKRRTLGSEPRDMLKRVIDLCCVAATVETLVQAEMFVDRVGPPGCGCALTEVIWPEDGHQREQEQMKGSARLSYTTKCCWPCGAVQRGAPLEREIVADGVERACKAIQCDAVPKQDEVQRPEEIPTHWVRCENLVVKGLFIVLAAACCIDSDAARRDAQSQNVCSAEGERTISVIAVAFHVLSRPAVSWKLGSKARVMSGYYAERSVRSTAGKQDMSNLNIKDVNTARRVSGPHPINHRFEYGQTYVRATFKVKGMASRFSSGDGLTTEDIAPGTEHGFTLPHHVSVSRLPPPARPAMVTILRRTSGYMPGMLLQAALQPLFWMGGNEGGRGRMTAGYSARRGTGADKSEIMCWNWSGCASCSELGICENSAGTACRGHIHVLIVMYATGLQRDSSLGSLVTFSRGLFQHHDGNGVTFEIEFEIGGEFESKSARNLYRHDIEMHFWLYARDARGLHILLFVQLQAALQPLFWMGGNEGGRGRMTAGYSARRGTGADTSEIMMVTESHLKSSSKSAANLSRNRLEICTLCVCSTVFFAVKDKPIHVEMKPKIWLRTSSEEEKCECTTRALKKPEAWQLPQMSPQSSIGHCEDHLTWQMAIVTSTFSSYISAQKRSREISRHNHAQEVHCVVDLQETSDSLEESVVRSCRLKTKIVEGRADSVFTKESARDLAGKYVGANVGHRALRLEWDLWAHAEVCRDLALEARSSRQVSGPKAGYSLTCVHRRGLGTIRMRVNTESDRKAKNNPLLDVNTREQENWESLDTCASESKKIRGLALGTLPVPPMDEM